MLNHAQKWREVGLNARSLAFVAVRLGALYLIATSLLEMAKNAADVVRLISGIIYMDIGNENVAYSSLLFLLLPIVVPLICGILLWCLAYRLSQALAPAKLRLEPPIESAGTRSNSEDHLLPLRSHTHGANPILRTCLHIGLGISGIMLLVNSIPEFIKLLIMLTNQEAALFAEHTWTEDSANFVKVIVQMLLGICLAAGAGGIARFFTRTAPSS